MSIESRLVHSRSKSVQEILGASRIPPARRGLCTRSWNFGPEFWGRNFGAGILGGNFGLDFWAGIWGRRFRLGAASFDQVRQGSPKVRMPLNRLNRSLSNLVDPCRTLSTRDAPCRPLSHRTEFSKISSYRFTKPSWVRPHVLIPWRI